MISLDLSVVIPVYNNSSTIEILAKQINKFMLERKLSFEIIFVDDGSIDNSWEVIEKMSSTDNNIKGIKLKRNSGQHNALIAGLKIAEGDLMITMDADLQDHVDDIHLFLDKYKNNQHLDVILGERENYRPSVIKYFGSKMFFFLFRLFSNISIKNSSNFRLIKSSAIGELFAQDLNNIQLSITPYKLGMNVGYIKVKWEKTSAKSSYTLPKLFKLGMSNLINFSNINILFPLSLISILIVILTITFIYVIYNYMTFGINVPGYLSIFAIVIIGTLINLITYLFMLILLNKILKIIRKDSIYIIDKIINKNKK